MRRSWLLAIVLAAGPASAGIDTLRTRSGTNHLTWLADSDSTAHVTVVDRRTSRKVYDEQLRGVNAKHYHPAEYHNGHLYAIRRIGNWHWSSRDWTDELWRYEGSQPRRKLFEGQGLDFGVAPNESVVVVSNGGDPPGSGVLTLMSAHGTVLRKFRASDLHLDYLGSMWVTNQFVFVLEDGPGAGFARLIRFSCADWSWVAFDLAELRIDSDCDFDPERQLVAGSDYPFFYDAESGEDWRRGRPVVTLRLYDLATRTSTAITTSVAKWFEPRWLRPGVLEFDDPDTGKRVTRTIGAPQPRSR